MTVSAVTATVEDSPVAHEQISRRVRLVCIWCGIPLVFLVFGGFIYSSFMVPIPPTDTAEQVAQIYRSRTGAIRLGLAVSFFANVFLLPFGIAIAAQTRRIRSVPTVLIYTQIASCAAGSLSFVIPWVFWLTAAFRPERQAPEIMLLNDLGWMYFVMVYVAFTPWMIAIGAAILLDTGADPVYPRWLGYFAIFLELTFFPDSVIPFFKTGPLAWNGIFPYWLPFILFGIWVPVMVAYTTVAIKREAAVEQNDAHSAAAGDAGSLPTISNVSRGLR